MRHILFVLASAVVLSTASASAQTMPACNGDMAIVRVSQIKPTSTLAAYMKAQEAHIAWYRKNGFSNNLIYSSPVIVTDPNTKASKYSASPDPARRGTLSVVSAWSSGPPPPG